jgi:hypothetical protein
MQNFFYSSKLLVINSRKVRALLYFVMWCVGFPLPCSVISLKECVTMSEFPVPKKCYQAEGSAYSECCYTAGTRTTSAGQKMLVHPLGACGRPRVVTCRVQGLDTFLPGFCHCYAIVWTLYHVMQCSVNWDIFNGVERWYVYLYSSGSAVGIATGCGQDEWEAGARVSVGSRHFVSTYRPHRLWGPPSFLSIGCWGPFLRSNAAESWSWPITSIHLHGVMLS